ncbi:hypothetical protein ACWD0A_34345 [Streptomyces sp. NPDC002867]
MSVLPFHNFGEYTDVDAEAVLDVIALLSLTSGRIGGAVVCTNHADDTSRVLGWRLSDCIAPPLGRAEIFSAYCTDAATGEPIPPEPGTEYAVSPPVLAWRPSPGRSPTGCAPPGLDRRSDSLSVKGGSHRRQ